MKEALADAVVGVAVVKQAALEVGGVGVLGDRGEDLGGQPHSAGDEAQARAGRQPVAGSVEAALPGVARAAEDGVAEQGDGEDAVVVDERERQHDRVGALGVPGEDQLGGSAAVGLTDDLDGARDDGVHILAGLQVGAHDRMPARQVVGVDHRHRRVAQRHAVDQGVVVDVDAAALEVGAQRSPLRADLGAQRVLRVTRAAHPDEHVGRALGLRGLGAGGRQDTHCADRDHRRAHRGRPSALCPHCDPRFVAAPRRGVMPTQANLDNRAK